MTKDIIKPHVRRVTYNPPSSDAALAAQGRRDALSIFCQEHSVLIPRREVDDWRVTEHVAGQINGLPMSRGVLLATNGILCYILRSDGTLFLGHYKWFEEDEKEKKVKVKWDLSEYAML